MKERPILFSAPMVRALLAGTKTQTRRVMNPQPIGGTARRLVMADDVPERWQDCDDVRVLCPYGVPGDRLWVRETWAEFPSPGDWIYRAAIEDIDADLAPKLRWRPSIFMPRAASRITLEVHAVRVERLQAITEEDAKAEGIEPRACSHPDCGAKGCGGKRRHVGAFAIGWDSINGKRAPWASNPWVWVVTFRKHEATS